MRKIIDFIVLIVMVLLFFPYMGDVGANVFKMLGKYYYLVVMSICAFCILMKTIVSPKIVFKTIGLKVLLVLAMYLVYFLIFHNSADNVYFGIILFVFFTFSFIAFKDNNMRLVSVVSALVLYVFLGISLVKKCEYFNPNSYAFLSTELFLWSIFSLHFIKTKAFKFIFYIVNVAVGVILTYVIYNSATQLICVMGFAFLYLIKDTRIVKTKFFYFLMVTSVFLALTVFPFIVVSWMDQGIVDGTFFTNRGERWHLAADAIRQVGIFNTYSEKIGAHNGFLEMSLNYSMFVAIIYVVFLYIVLLRFYKKYRNDSKCRMLAFMFVVFILMNCTESFFIGLTDSYFLIIVLSCLVTRIEPVKVKKVKVVRRIVKVEKYSCEEHNL